MDSLPTRVVRAARSLPELWATLALGLGLVGLRVLVPPEWTGSLGWQIHPYQVFAVCAALAVFTLPGAMLLRMLGLGGGWAVRLPAAFAAAVGVWVLPSLLVAATASFDVRFLMLVGAGVSVVLTAIAVLRALLAPANVASRAGEPLPYPNERLNLWLAGLALAVLGLAAWLSFRAPVALDDNLQVMYVQDDLVVPRINEFEPVFGAGIAPHTRGSLTTWPINLTAITFLAGLPAQQTFWILRTPLVLLSLLAVYAFSLHLFRSRNLALFAALVYFVLSLVYTLDADAIGFGLYARGAQDKFIARYLMFPSALAWSLSYLRRPDPRTYWLAGICTIGLSTTHPIGIILLAIPLGGLGLVHLANHLQLFEDGSLWRPSRWGIRPDGAGGWLRKRLSQNWPVMRPFALLSIFSLLGVVVPLIAKTSADAPVVAYSLTDTRDPTLWYRVNLALDYQRLLVSGVFGPEAYIVHPRIFLDAVILIPLLAWPLFWRRARKHMIYELIVGTFVLNPALLLLPPVVQFIGGRATPWLLYRLAWPLSLLGPIALTYVAWRLVESLGDRIHRPALRSALPLGVLALMALALGGKIHRGVTFLEEYRDDSFATQCRTLQPLYSRLPDLVGDGTVVLSTPDNDLCMVASAANAYPVEFGLTTTINRFPEERLPEALQRLDDVYAFTFARVVDQDFMDILTRWNVGLILLRIDHPLESQLRHMPQLFELALEESHHRVYRVRPEAGVGVLPDLPAADRWRMVRWQGEDPLVEANTSLSQGRWEAAVAAFEALKANENAAHLASIGLGRAHLSAGRLEQATAAYLWAAELDPGSALAWLEAGNAHWLREDYAAMAHAYERAVDQVNWNPEALSRLGEAYRQLGRTDAAGDIFRQAVASEVTPGSSTYYRELGALFLAVGWDEEARQALEQAVSIRETLLSYSLLSEAYTHLGDDGAAAGAARRARRLNFWSDIPRQMMGKIELERGDRQRALSYFRQALLLNPQSRAVDALAATTSGLHGDAAALAQVEALIGYRLGFADPVLAAARLQQSLGLFDQALDSGSQAWHWKPVDSQSAVFLGNLRFRLGHRESAAARYQDATQVNPFNPAPFLGLAALAEVNGDLGSAQGWGWMARTAAPFTPSTLIALGNMAGIQGQNAQALHYYSQATRVSPHDASPLVALADHQLAQGHWDQAQVNYRMALALRPDTAAAWRGLGRGYLGQGQITEAEQALRRAVELYPADGHSRMALAELLRQQGDLAGAQEQLRQAVELDPGNPDVYSALASSHIAGGEPLLAQAVLEGMIERIPSLPDGYLALGRLREMQGEPGGAESLYRLALERLPPGASASVSLALADLQLRRGLPEEALSLYRTVVGEQPMLAAGYIGVARSAALRGDMATARETLEAGRSLMPASPALNQAWALLLIGEGAVQDAEEAYRTAVVASPDSADLALGQARFYALRGEPVKAMAVVSDFRQRWPGDGEILRGGVSLAIDLGRPDEALELAQTLTTLAPGLASSWLVLGDAYANLGQFDRAEEALHWATELEPGNDQAWLALGRFLDQRAQPTEARRALARAMEAGRDAAGPHLALAGLLLREGRPEEALASYQTAAELDATQASAVLRQARLLRRLGRLREAEQVLDRARSLFPAEPLVYAARAELALIEGRVADAHSEYLAATRMVPGLCRPYLNLAEFLSARGENALAEAAYRETLARAGCASEAHVGLGTFLLSQAEAGPALEHFQRAVEADPGDDTAAIALASAYMDQARPRDALAALDRAFAANPASAALRIAASRVMIALARHDDALEATSQAVALEPAKAEGLIALAGVQRHLGRYEEAEHSFLRAIESDRSMAFAYVRLGDAYAAWARFDEAEAAYRRALAYGPANPLVHVSLAEFLESRGRTGEAVTLLEQAVERDRSKVGALLALSRIQAEAGQIEAAKATLLRGLEGAPALAPTFFDPSNVESLTEAPALTSHLFIGMGDIQRVAGNWEAAKADYGRAIEVAPGRPEGYLSLGQALVAQGHGEQALVQFEAARDAMPGSALPYLALGEWHQDRLDWAEAEAMYRGAIGVTPGDIRGYLRLGELLQARGRLDEARTILEKGTGVAPTSSMVYVALGNWLQNRAGSPDAQADYRRAIHIQAADPAGYVALGNWYQARGQRLEAIRQLLNAVKVAPTSPAPRLSLGRWYELERDWESAEVAFQAAIDLAPQDPRGHLGLGYLYLSQNRPGDALAQFHAVLAMVPGSAQAHAAMGDWYLANVDRSAAAGAAAQALEEAAVLARQADPTGDPDEMIELLTAGREDLRDGRTEQAYQHFEAAVAQDPDSILPYLAMGQWYRLVAEVPAAERAYQTAIELAPADSDVYIQLGRLYQRTGRLEEARSQFEAAIEVNPGSVGAWMAFGDSLRGLGDWPGAERAYRRAIEIAPGSLSGYVSLGETLWAQGRQREALEVYEVAVSAGIMTEASVCAPGRLPDLGGDGHLAQAALAQALEAGAWRCSWEGRPWSALVGSSEP